MIRSWKLPLGIRTNAPVIPYFSEKALRVLGGSMGSMCPFCLLFLPFMLSRSANKGPDIEVPGLIKCLCRWVHRLGFCHVEKYCFLYFKVFQLLAVWKVYSLCCGTAKSKCLGITLSLIFLISSQRHFPISLICCFLFIVKNPTLWISFSEEFSVGTVICLVSLHLC